MRLFLLTGLLIVGGSFSSLAQTTPTSAPTATAAALLEQPAPPRAATVLALGTPPVAVLPADLSAPLPAAYTAPANAARPNDGIQTTRWILGIAGAVLAVVVAVSAAK
jgi:hypothetical protein